MKPKFHNIPSSPGRVLLAGGFAFVSRPHWEMRGKKAPVRAAGRVFVTMVSLMAVGVGAQNIQPIYSFPQSPATPYAALSAGPDGNFHGTTWAGGSGGEGSMHKVTTNGVMTLLYSFSPPIASAGTHVTNTDGAQPESALTLGLDGNFHGITWKGGPCGNLPTRTECISRGIIVSQRHNPDSYSFFSCFWRGGGG